MWSDGERKDHMNGLELKAALFGIQSLYRDLHHCHIRIEKGDTTAMSFINHMGGTHSFACNAVTRELFLWCKARSMWLSACHMAGKDNSAADSSSRKTSIHTEWSLNKALFAQLCSTFGTPAVDFFAARTNHQLPQYVPLCPDPNVVTVNAFFHVWNECVYTFPPFNLIFTKKSFWRTAHKRRLWWSLNGKHETGFPKVMSKFISSHRQHFYSPPQTWRHFTLSPPSFI